MTISALKRLCAQATKGPWRSVRNSQDPYKHVIFDGKPDIDAMYTTSPLEARDADLIAAARTWMPKLIAVAERAKAYVSVVGDDTAELDALVDALKELREH